MIVSRPYQDETDRLKMADLVLVARPTEFYSTGLTSSNLIELLSLETVRASTRLWFDAHYLAAYAIVDHWNNLIFDITPTVSSSALFAEILPWAEACLLARSGENGEQVSLDASCREDDHVRLSLLTENGFILQPIRSIHMERSLSDPIPEYPLPPGFSIHPLQEAGTVEEAVALHRAAFGTNQMTVEERRAMMSVPEYDPQLDLIVTAPNGEFAAYCFCIMANDEGQSQGRKEGWTDPIGTHPGYQKLGLGKALLFEGFRRLKASGADYARTGTSSENLAMQSLALSTRFKITSSQVWFSKPL